MKPRKPLSELIRPPAARQVPAVRPVGPDTSLLRLKAAEERLAETRRTFARWKEETDRQLNDWRQQGEADHQQWMTQMNTRLKNLQQGR